MFACPSLKEAKIYWLPFIKVDFVVVKKISIALVLRPLLGESVPVSRVVRDLIGCAGFPNTGEDILSDCDPEEQIKHKIDRLERPHCDTINTAGLLKSSAREFM